MQLIHETIIKDFAISVVRDYLFGLNCAENCIRTAKEIVVCQDNWDEISKRVLTLAIVDRFDLRHLFYESAGDDLMAILLAAETIESAIIATAIDVFPDWEAIVLPQITAEIQKKIVRRWSIEPGARSLRPRVDKELEWLCAVESNPDNWEDTSTKLTSIELSARF